MKNRDKYQSRTINALRNTIVNALCQIINVLVNIAIPPLIISSFGSVVNGMISTVKQIISYLTLVGAGISESSVVYLYKPLMEKDQKRVSSIYNAVGASFFKAGSLFSLLSVAVAFLFPLMKNDGLSYKFIACMILILSLSGASEFFVVGKYRALLIADQKIFMVNIAQIAGSVVSAGITIVLIKVGIGILVVQLFASVTYIMRIGILYLYIKKEYKYLDRKIQPDSMAISKRKAATIHQVSGLAIFGSQSIFVAYFCGFAEASVYSVYNIIIAGINTLLGTFSSALLASMGNLMAEDDLEHLRSVYSMYEVAFYMLAFSVYAATVILIIPFIKLYTASATDVNYIRMDVADLFIAMGIFNSMRTPGGTMINAKGLYRETQYRAIIEMTICIVGQIALVNFLEIKGVLIATTAAFLYRTIDVIVFNHKYILLLSCKAALAKLLVNICAIGILVYLNSILEIRVESYFQWALLGTFVFLGCLIVFFLLNYLTSKKAVKSIAIQCISLVKR